jgi:hypothetical protein
MIIVQKLTQVKSTAMNQPTIKQLRQQGFKVRVLHTRKYHTPNAYYIDNTRRELLPKGGSTKIEITTPDKTTTVFGESICSDEDLFNRKVGNSIALGRALKALEYYKLN